MSPVFSGLSAKQADGLACIVCNTRYDTDGAPPSVPVGSAAPADGGGQVFACAPPEQRCAVAVGYVPAGDQLALEEAGR